MIKILVLAPYDSIYPPHNGGMVRCYNLILQMGLYFDSTVLSFQDPSTIPQEAAGPGIKWKMVSMTPAFKDAFSMLPAGIASSLRYRWLVKSLFKQANGHFLSYYQAVKQELEGNAYDLVCIENLTLASMASLIKKIKPGIRVIYDAYNIDSALAKEDLEKGLISRRTFQEIKEVESNLHKHVDKVLACSSEDANGLHAICGDTLSVSVIPNGTRLYDGLFDEGVQQENPDKILFCGSLDYEPNREGLAWFYKSIWPLIRKENGQIRLLVVGSGKPGEGMQGILQDESVVFAGRVPDVKTYYNQAAISVVPLKSGSGTRLKILEAMSLGVPVVSTSKGAEGVGYNKDRDILIADSEASFAKAVLTLIKDKPRRIAIQQQAGKLVQEKYDWNKIGRRLQEVVETCVKSH